MATYKAPLMLIAGEWTKGSGRPIEIINPATEEVIATLPSATEADLDGALQSAQRGFATSWRIWSKAVSCRSTISAHRRPIRRLAGSRKAVMAAKADTKRSMLFMITKFISQKITV